MWPDEGQAPTDPVQPGWGGGLGGEISWFKPEDSPFQSDPNSAIEVVAEPVGVVLHHPGLRRPEGVAVGPGQGGLEPSSAACAAGLDLDLIPCGRAAGGEEDGRQEGDQKQFFHYLPPSSKRRSERREKILPLATAARDGGK